MPDRHASAPSSASFGANDWLVEEMYDQYRRDPSSVSEGWREFFLSLIHI